MGGKIYVCILWFAKHEHHNDKAKVLELEFKNAFFMVIWIIVKNQTVIPGNILRCPQMMLCGSVG